MPDNPSGQLTTVNGIGALRWPVALYCRIQEPADDLALDEDLVLINRTHADIQPTYESTFWQSTQIETPVTHAVTIRWRNYPSTIEVVFRPTFRDPVDKVWRGELFRVRRSKEIGGRKRFIMMMCEIEHSRTIPDPSHASATALLTEPYDGKEAAPPP